MGCTSSAEKPASLPARCHSTVSKLSKKASRKLSRKLSTRSSGKQEATLEPLVEASTVQPEPETSQVMFSKGPALTLLESRFDAKFSKCSSCGNTGLGMDGRFCKCPYGRRNPPARLRDGDVEVDVGPLNIGPDGNAVLPKMRLGIRGPYIYEASGCQRRVDPSWTHKYMFCASMGSTWSHILEQVQTKAKRPSAGRLLDAMPEILSALQEYTGVDMASERHEAEISTRGDDHLHAHGVMYAFSTGVAADQFLAKLDYAGYDTVTCEDSALQQLGILMKASVSHDHHVVRISLYQTDSRTGFDGIIRLRRPAAELKVPEKAES